MSEIKVGDRVRSFDFEGRELEGERACYREGVVIGIGRFGFPDCDRYKIFVDRVVWAGEEDVLSDNDPVAGRVIYPPVNGVPMVFRGRVTDGVHLLEAA